MREDLEPFFFPQKIRRAFLPHPPARRIQNARTTRAEAKQNPFPPAKIVFALPRPHFAPPPCPNTWRTEPRKKNTLSFFKKKSTPAKSEMQGVFFFSGLPPSPRGGRRRGVGRIGTKSERKIWVKATTHAERAKCHRF